MSSNINIKESILEWAKERQLINPDNAYKQTIKLSEEVGELSGAILKGKQDEVVDAIGDIQVVLIILSEQLGISYDDALKSAYETIKNRTGKTINGTFIKDEQ